MLTTARHTSPLWWGSWGLLLLALLAGRLCAQTEPPRSRDGMFLTVPNPITDQAINDLKLKIKRAVDKRRTIDTLVFDFNPQEAPSGTSSFWAASELADFIRSLQQGQVAGLQPKTVAFIHNQVSSHTVLPVLACSQIVMSKEIDPSTRLPKAKLGDVVSQLPTPLSKQQRSVYQEQAERYASPDLILRMLDPNLPLAKIKTEEAIQYASPARLEKLKEAGKRFVVQSPTPPGLEPGKTLFGAEMARELGLCQGFANNRSELREMLGLSMTSLNEDWLANKQVIAWRIDVTGPLDKGRIDSLRRRINFAIGRGANFLILSLDSPNGDTTYAAGLAEEIRHLRDKSDTYPVRTLAYIPPHVSLGAATFLALGCREIAMGQEASLADFNYLRADSADLLKRREEMLLPLVRAQGLPEALFQATLTKGLTLVRVRTPSGFDRIVTEEQLRQDQEGPKLWQAISRINALDGFLLTVPAALAQETHITSVTDLNTPEQLYRYYDLEPAQVRVSRDDMLDRVAEFFREPTVNFLLIMLGIIGLILEMKLPGTTIPGALAAICFVLFFWAYSFVGEFTMLAVLLFLLGLVLIGVEIFVIPGFGFCGIAGIALLITSLALVTLERWPETSQDWTRLGSSMTMIAMSLMAALVGAFLLAWFLPSMPYLNRLVLQPPEDEAVQASGASGPMQPALLGAIGIAATALRPAGKVQFGEEFLDVVAEGDYVNPGSRVQVIELEGQRIVVKEIHG